MSVLSCFKAYDIRGNANTELTPAFANALGQALAENPGQFILGYDARLTSPGLHNALASGLASKGASIHSLGLCCTEEIYRAAQVLPCDYAVMITGSHNPANENGFKIVRKGAIPVNGDSGLKEIAAMVSDILAVNSRFPDSSPEISQNSILRPEYIAWLLAYTGAGNGKKLKIVTDCGNGCAGLLLKSLARNLPHEIVLLNENPDGEFPGGVPNPLLPEKREQTAQAVKKEKADFGVAWDGDADRCFFYDEYGNFIEGYYLVGLLAQALLQKNPGEKIIHDPRLYWNTREMVNNAGGIPIKGKTGHAFMKERMRAENAVYGGEMSAHHYFRDFGYCDSGMLPFLLLANLLSHSGKSLSQILADRMAAYPCSGEINRPVANADEAIRKAADFYQKEAKSCDWLDGLDMDLGSWRFSLRKSNTEPLLRLNVESRGDEKLMRAKTAEILALLDKSFNE